MNNNDKPPIFSELPPGTGEFGLEIPAVGGTQLIWVTREISSLEKTHAIAAHYGVSIEHVRKWLELLSNKVCQATRRDGAPCQGHITDRDIPANPALFDPYTIYTCPAHTPEIAKSSRAAAAPANEAWYVDPRGYLARIVDQGANSICLQYRLNLADWVGTINEFKETFKPF